MLFRSAQFSGAVVSYNASSRKVTVRDFIQDNLLTVSLIVGLTATRTIRALDRQDAKTIPIIAMTANAFREDAEKCMEAGMNAHLAKPLDDEKIKQTISEELRKQNACHE